MVYNIKVSLNKMCGQNQTQKCLLCKSHTICYTKQKFITSVLYNPVIMIDDMIKYRLRQNKFNIYKQTISQIVCIKQTILNTIMHNRIIIISYIMRSIFLHCSHNNSSVPISCLRHFWKFLPSITFKVESFN